MARGQGQLGVIARALGLVVVAGSMVAAAGATSPKEPGGSVLSPSGNTVGSNNASYSIPVEWNASCPLPDGAQLKFHHWNVEIQVTRAADGKSANHQSRGYVGTTDSGTNNKQGMVVMLTKGLKSETFNVELTLACGSTKTVIGNKSITISKGACDPDLLEKSDRKYEIAKELNATGQEELKKAEEIAADVLKQYGVDKLSEYDLLQTLETAAEHAAATGGEWIAEASDVVGVVYELAKIDQLLTGEIAPAVQDMDDLQQAAVKDFAAADAEAKKAKADLDAALAQGPCVGPARDELNKLLQEAGDEEKIHNKVESWRAAGSNELYVVNNELVNEDAAIKAARAIVQSARTTQSAAAKRRLSEEQVRAALADMHRAIAQHGKAATLLKHAHDRDKALRSHVAALLR